MRIACTAASSSWLRRSTRLGLGAVVLRPGIVAQRTRHRNRQPLPSIVAVATAETPAGRATRPARSDRLLRPLAAAVAVVMALGLVGAAVVDRSADGDDPTEAAVTPVGDVGPVPRAPGVGTDDVVAESPGGGAAAQAAPTTVPALLLPSSAAVPAPGTHRYEVTSTTDGSTSGSVEEVEVTRLSGGDAAGAVQIAQRTDGRGQVSVLDWSPSGAQVRSTEIDEGSSCTWEPPITEFGVLEPGATWSVDSRCTTTVAGADTTVDVTGTGRVAASQTVTAGGGPVDVWRIERQRTTVLRATVGGDAVEQRVDESSVIFFDPARGIAVRREATVTRSGEQTGTTERISVLQPA